MHARHATLHCGRHKTFTPLRHIEQRLIFEMTLQEDVIGRLWSLVSSGGASQLQLDALRFLCTLTRTPSVARLKLLDAGAVPMLVHMLTQPEGLAKDAKGQFMNFVKEGEAAPQAEGIAAHMQAAAAQLLAHAVTQPACLDQVRSALNNKSLHMIHTQGDHRKCCKVSSAFKALLCC